MTSKIFGKICFILFTLFCGLSARELKTREMNQNSDLGICPNSEPQEAYFGYRESYDPSGYCWITFATYGTISKAMYVLIYSRFEDMPGDFLSKQFLNGTEAWAMALDIELPWQSSAVLNEDETQISMYGIKGDGRIIYVVTLDTSDGQLISTKFFNALATDLFEQNKHYKNIFYQSLDNSVCIVDLFTAMGTCYKKSSYTSVSFATTDTGNTAAVLLNTDDSYIKALVKLDLGSQQEESNMQIEHLPKYQGSVSWGETELLLNESRDKLYFLSEMVKVVNNVRGDYAIFLVLNYSSFELTNSQFIINYASHADYWMAEKQDYLYVFFFIGAAPYFIRYDPMTDTKKDYIAGRLYKISGIVNNFPGTSLVFYGMQRYYDGTEWDYSCFYFGMVADEFDQTEGITETTVFSYKVNHTMFEPTQLTAEAWPSMYQPESFTLNQLVNPQSYPFLTINNETRMNDIHQVHFDQTFTVRQNEVDTILPEVSCSLGGLSAVSHSLQPLEASSSAEWIQINPRTGELSYNTTGVPLASYLFELISVSGDLDYSISNTIKITVEEADAAHEEETDSFIYLISLGIGTLSSLASALTNSGSLLCFWATVHHLQMILLLTLINTQIAPRVLSYLQQQNIVLFHFNYLKTQSIPAVKNLVEIFDSPQKDKGLEDLGLRSLSTINNLYSLFWVVLAIILFHVLLLKVMPGYRKSLQNTKDQSCVSSSQNEGGSQSESEEEKHHDLQSEEDFPSTGHEHILFDGERIPTISNGNEGGAEEANAKHGKCKRLYIYCRRKLLQFLHDAAYLRLFLVASLCILLSSINELVNPQSNISQVLSWIINFGILALMGVFYFIMFKRWYKDSLHFDADRKDYLSEMYSGLKNTKWARLHTPLIMTRRLILVIVVLLLGFGTKYLCFTLFTVIQVSYILQFLVVRPYEGNMMNVIEILNEIFLLTFILMFFGLSGSSNWGYGMENLVLVLFSLNAALISVVTVAFGAIKGTKWYFNYMKTQKVPENRLRRSQRIPKDLRKHLPDLDESEKSKSDIEKCSKAKVAANKIRRSAKLKKKSKPLESAEDISPASASPEISSFAPSEIAQEPNQSEDEINSSISSDQEQKDQSNGSNGDVSNYPESSQESD